MIGKKLWRDQEETMEHPDKRVGALARVLTKVLSVEQERLEAEGEGSSSSGSLLDDPKVMDDMLQDLRSRTVRVSQERAQAPAQLAELLGMPNHERETVVATQPRLQTYSLASYTLERCEKVVSHDPIMAGELARLARTIAEQADPRTCGGSAALADLEAYATAMEGNAQRVAGDLRESFRTFMDARRAQDRGGADPDLSARVDMLEASLRRDLRQFPAALELLEKAERVFFTLKDRNLQARTVINRANVFLVMRELDQVVENLQKALPLAQDPWLALVVRHNLIFALAECGRANEAAQLYERSKDLYLQFNDPLTTSRRLWAEGLIARELDEDLEHAERLLTQAAERLAEHGYAFDAALAGLDLVTVYARRGDSPEVLRVASALVHLFQMRDVHPEALATLKMVHEAAEKQAVNLTLLAQAAEKVRANQVRGNPTN
jgi:tetratricopeptide (TPR) repeat protein